MTISSLDDNPDYKAYKDLPALPNLTPSYEKKNVGTTYNTDKEKGEIGPAEPMRKGISPVFGEMHCRVKMAGGILCGGKYRGRGALEHHLKHDHKLVLEATKKGRPFSTTVIAAKDFYSSIMRLHRIQVLEQMCANGKTKYKEVDTAAEDSGLEDDGDTVRHPETFRVLAAIESLKPRKNNDLTAIPDRKSINRALTVTQRRKMEKLLEAANLTELNSRNVPRHCDPKQENQILVDDNSFPLRPMRYYKQEWKLNVTAAIKIMKFFKMSLGPCTNCREEVEDLKKIPKTCMFVRGCKSYQDFSKVKYRPSTGQWEEIVGRRLLVEDEDKPEEV